MMKAEKRIERAPLKARPKPDIDREALRAKINKQFSETLDYLGR